MDPVPVLDPPDTEPSADVLLDARGVGELLLTDRHTIRRWYRQGRIPPPDAWLTTKAPRWWKSTILRFLAGGANRD